MEKEILVGVLLVGVICLGVFLYISIDSLDYNQVGLNYSEYFKSVENKTYYSGFHFLGIGHQFLKYQLNVATMEFSLESTAVLPPIECRTKDGLSLRMEVAFQYKPVAENIYEIYMNYADEIEDILLRVAIDSLSQTSTYYNASAFFDNKLVIMDDMIDNLAATLRKEVHIEMVFFQLLSIGLPTAYEQAIQDTEVSRQNIDKAKASRNKNIVTQDTRIYYANISSQVIINEAKAVADSNKILAEAQASTFYNLTTVQAASYADLKANLTFGNPDLVNYIKNGMVKDYPQGKLMLSLKDF